MANSSDTEFKIGDEVVYTNSYGVVFRNKTIVGTEIVDGEVRYFYAPTDAPWFSVKAKQLKKE